MTIRTISAAAIILTCTSVFAAPPSPDSLPALREQQALHGLDLSLRKRLADALVARGRELMEGAQYEEAASVLGEAVELYPEAAPLHFMRGNALYLLKKYDAARWELDAARRVGGNSFHLLYLLGLTFYEEGELAEAVSLWEQGLALQGAEPERENARTRLEKAKGELALQQRMRRGESGRFTLSYDSHAVPQLAGEVLDALEDAYVSVGYDLMHYPEAKVPVILYTAEDYRAVTRSPDWSGGIYDGKIRIPLKGARELDAQLRAVLRHEFVHVVVAELTHGRCPTWLNEGLAEIEGRKAFDPASHGAGVRLRLEGLLPMQELSSGFTGMQGKRAATAYEQSHSMASFLVASRGWGPVRELLGLLGEGASFEDAFRRAYEPYGIDFPSFLGEWRDNLAAAEKNG
ncbi:MAG TPA: hypothetical protein VNX25_09865 [Verrucomicrobiae bacterium]|nr:hypothetical protein [Verrucomicrobiae bacterium]